MRDHDPSDIYELCQIKQKGAADLKSFKSHTGEEQ